jgi:hypothetical protein
LQAGVFDPDPTARPADRVSSSELHDYAEKAVEGLSRAKRLIHDTMTRTKDPGILRRIDRFLESVDYVLNEWRALKHIIKGAGHVRMADAADNDRDRSLHLDLAKKDLEAAKTLSDQRRHITESTPTPGLYWDLTGTDGPVAVFRHSDIHHWLNIITGKTPDTD